MRLWLFRLIALTVIPALLILVLEFGLRLTGYGYSTRAIVKCTVKGQKAYCENNKFCWLFFPQNIAREFTPFVIPSKKSENTYRIFVLGSSAAQGTPDSAYGFSRILEVMLSEQYPAANFEVINTGMAAINSHVVVEIAEECAKYKPDLFVIYMGNNEVIGPYGAGTVFAPLSNNLSLIHLGIALRGTKSGQLLTNLSRALGQGKVPKVWRGMELFTDKQVSADDKNLQVVYNNYRDNLETIVKTAQKRKIPVVLATVGSNLKDCPPFASVHRTYLTEDEKKNFEKLYKEGIEIESAAQTADKKEGRYEQALEKYLSCAAIDGEFAELHYRIGRLLFLSGQYDEARQRYIKASELDTIRFRADNRINEIIRETAQKENSNGVYFADAVAALEKESPHQISGNELFYEHVHLTFRGNYILAKAVYEQIEKILPDQIKKEKSGGQENLDENKCMQSLAYSDWDKYMILQSLLNGYIAFPPFTNQLYHEKDVESLKQQINSLKKNLNNQVFLRIDAEYHEAINRRPTDWMLHWKYGNFLMEGLKDYRAAEEEFNKVLELVPQYYMAHVMLGDIWRQVGNSDEALSHLKEAIKIRPTYAPAYYDMGLIYQKKKMVKDAERSYKKALRLNPEHYPSYINLGFLLASEGRPGEAIKVCRSGLEFFPDSEDLHYNLGCILRQDGQKEEAIKEFRTVLEKNPKHNLAKQDLEMILKESQ